MILNQPAIYQYSISKEKRANKSHSAPSTHDLKQHMISNKHMNKCSAVAEVGDHIATIDMGRKLGAVALFSGELDHHLTQCGLGRGLPLYRVAS